MGTTKESGGDLMYQAVMGVTWQSVLEVLGRLIFPPAALNWCQTMPQPAVVLVTFRHPRRGMTDGYRAKYCESDSAIAELIMKLWCVLPTDAAMEPLFEEDDGA